jgi:hypothetical protein
VAQARGDSAGHGPQAEGAQVAVAAGDGVLRDAQDLADQPEGSPAVELKGLEHLPVKLVEGDGFYHKTCSM